MSKSILIRRLAIIGVGLIGGSLGLALRRAKFCQTVAGCVCSTDDLARALDLGVIDEDHVEPAHAVENADVIVIATPLGATEAVLDKIRGGLKTGAVVTDVGSVKGSVVNAARKALGPGIDSFVPGHPIAGTEQSGINAAFAELFQDHRVILTPVPETRMDAVDLITKMWEAAGAGVNCLEVQHHDEVLAATSHLPHMLAYALVDCLADMQECDEIFQFAAGGFADFTRIASSSPEMWHDVCFSNRTQLLNILNRFDGHIAEIKRVIKNADSAALLNIFMRAKTARDRFIDNRGTNT